MKAIPGSRLVGSLLAAGAFALALPGASWAGDHLLSVNGATVSQAAIVTPTGSLTQPLILSNFDGVTSLTLGQGQSLTPINILVKMCKPGTNNQLEWLSQGNTFVGVNGTLTSETGPGPTPQNGYRLTLTTTITDSYSASNGPCTVSGAKSYTVNPAAVIDKRAGSSANFNNRLTSTYKFWNVLNTAPEPGTLLLMATALAAFGWMARRRLRANSGTPA